MAWPSEAGAIAQTRSHGKALQSGCIGRGRHYNAFYREVSLTSSRVGNIVTITADSFLEGTVYYYWYVDGAYVERTTSNEFSIFVDTDEQVNIEVRDSNDPSFNALLNSPQDYPSRRTIYWNAVPTGDISYYRVDQSQDGGDWSAIGKVYHYPSKWEYFLYSPILEDLSVYQWKITPVDFYLNDGTPITLDSETVVMKPSAVDFTHTFDDETTKVTYTEA